ncbi:hypothetical protein [Acidovorax sp. A1169]|uniref:hypothetical protein n=1 Tax=Acidovorax sp. A1169 TaxID=3059524 RepID=UPI002737ABEB|nr:hypothetical protein [Acidovorax sp. A1169]MDP4074447.1 hypothetical protein [Acidovorax sp. A1169]
MEIATVPAFPLPKRLSNPCGFAGPGAIAHLSTMNKNTGVHACHNAPISGASHAPDHP